MRYVIFLKPACILEVEVNLKESGFNINDYLKPSAKTMMGEITAATKKKALEKASKKSGLPESYLTAYELLT